MRDRITDPWGDRTPYSPGGAWPVRVDEHTIETPDHWVRSASLLHSNGDAIDIGVRDGRIVGVRGRAGDRVNHGRLDPKDVYGWRAGAHPDRLTRPLVRVDGELTPTTWDDAMRRVVGASRARTPEQTGFYTSGQLFLEEYYTLAVIAKAGIGTPHLDGNTRLCTATSAAALKASFGTDGQPGSYTDVDHCDAIALWGHNVAETQTVLWMRMLDRRHGTNPPAMLAVDPRRTPVAREADVHLPIRPGTNLALMNGLLRLVIDHGWTDEAYLAAHTVGFEELAKVVDAYPVRRVAEICDLRPADIERAGELVGTAGRLLSTVLQGFYQSHQATASAVAVNDLHLLRGMIGRPGAGVLQMNGQPTAQNTRETGADGDLPGFRNRANPAHVRDLAALWNVDEATIPHDTDPTPAMTIWELAGKGAITFLWISGTNPAVSLPDLARVRRTLARPDLFVVVQDIFRTETAEFADVVLPAATWGEKTGTFTNADRTVHLSEKAVDPPGEARPDLDIFLDYAARRDFRDRDGSPLISWTDPPSAYAAWQRCSAGRPCDYTTIGYDDLRGESGVQWGGERLYTGGVFNTGTGYCETYGHDLVTGAPRTAGEHRAQHPDGRAFLLATPYEPAPEEPSADYPLRLITGRTLSQFHTRTKTGRVRELNAAAPHVWVEVSQADATEYALADGSVALIESARGAVEAPVRIRDIRPGTVFLPFHFARQAANELTLTTWDPVSKQPMFKLAAIRLRRQP
ncbi:molybdopterin oxidoreductase family protein [Actinoplanes subglobosus]|uniref:Molybdopterin oxidoreductase family protein n=1 Tax=Actinoplanes subglobosus TaxID=1547892 RepID=A0ABV8IWE2_9ACTN